MYYVADCVNYAALNGIVAYYISVWYLFNVIDSTCARRRYEAVRRHYGQGRGWVEVLR
jgi:uncharacterized membrane protein